MSATEPSSEEKTAAGKPPRLAGFLLALFALAASAYYPALKAGYLNWDDPAYTLKDPLVRHFTAANLKTAFTAPRMTNYIPLTDVSLAAESALFGESAAVHHGGNLLLHSLNTVLLFLLVFSLAGEPWAAFWAALLWAVHPTQTESVCWLAERKNLLYSFFYFGAVLAYLRHSRAPNRLTLASVSALFLAALLSKASAVTLPLVFLLLDVYLKTPFTRSSVAEKTVFLLTAGFFIVISALAQGQNGRIIPASPVPLFSFYLLKVFWPFKLSALYPYSETSRLLSAHRWLFLAPAAVFAAALWAALKKDRLVVFGLFFFFLNLLPFLILVPVGPSLAADRYLYMPLAGLSIATAAVAARVRLSGRFSPLFTLAALTVCAVLSKATLARAAVWNSDLPLWQDVARQYPGNGVAELNLAAANLAAGRPAEAEALLSALLQADPGNQKALYDLGTLYGMTGRCTSAENLLKRSLALKPGDAMAWNNLGLAQLKLGRPADAKKAFLVATAIDPGFAPAYSNLSEADKALRPHTARVHR